MLRLDNENQVLKPGESLPAHDSVAAIIYFFLPPLLMKN